MRGVRSNHRRERIHSASAPYSVGMAPHYQNSRDYVHGISGTPAIYSIDGHLPLHSKVYVGNLSFETEWQELKDHMRSAGNVIHVKIIQDMETGKSKGCGIVEFSSPREAVNAVRILNDSVLNGRVVHVREDKDATAAVGTKVYVGSMSYDTQWQELKDHMRAAGNVIR
eukprot:gene16025-21751_t